MNPIGLRPVVNGGLQKFNLNYAIKVVGGREQKVFSMQNFDSFKFSYMNIKFLPTLTSKETSLAVGRAETFSLPLHHAL